MGERAAVNGAGGVAERHTAPAFLEIGDLLETERLSVL
jgi:hypothetical protein